MRFPFLWPLALACGACAARPSATLPESVDRILAAHADPSVKVAIEVRSLRTGQVLFARDERLLMHPASCMKLLTLGAALDRGLLDRKAVTRLFEERGSGALLLLGGGDPMLETADLDALLDEAAKNGSALDGPILVSGALFAGPRFGAGWMWDDEPQRYMPYLDSALTLNGGALDVKARLGAEPGAAIVVEVDPPCEGFTFDQRLAIGAGIGGAGGDRPTATIRRDPGSRRIVLEGTLRPGDQVEESLSVPDPDLYAGEVLKLRLRRRAGAARATPEVRRIDAATLLAAKPWANVDWTLVARVERPMESVLTFLLKRSDNLGAEFVLRHLALAVDPEVPATPQRGLEVVAGYLAKLGIPESRVRLGDGSGMSLVDLVSADTLVAVLADLARRPDFARVKPMLPLAGVDGTLATRMRLGLARANLQAKTGTLSGISTLAGYVDTRDGEPLVFAILVENYTGPADPWRELQDQVGDALASAVVDPARLEPIDVPEDAP